jgi:ABC-type multidrug transport system fused ATPase/permease subunit
VALARALYSDADVFLLDDVLSAVDPKVAEHIFSEALCRMLRERGKTVIMATNHVHLLPRFDHVVMLDAGRVVEQGSLRELVARGSDIEGLVRSAVTGSSALDAAAAAAVATAASAGDDEQKKPDRASKRGGAGARERERDDGKLVVEEDRATGAVPMQSYLVYAAAFGWGLVVVRLAVEALELGARTGTDFWLADWSTRRDLTSRENTVAVLVYTAWSLASVALVVGGSVLFAVGAVRAVRNLHAQLLTGVLAAPMSFFESTPVGRILNRFSRDLDKVATELPMSLSNAVGASFEVVFTLIALAVATKGIFSPLIVPFSFLFYHVQASYRATARELQRLDSIARSPVFAHFSETLAGIGTIRAFEQSARFARQNEFLVNEHARISYTVIAGSSWLTVRLDSISAFVSFSVAVIIVAVDDLLPAGWAGLALAYSFNLAFNLMFATQNFAAVENSMTSVQRIGHYCREIESERAIVAPEPAKIPEDWPREGALEVRDLWLSYRTGGPVLKGLNLRIAPGQRVGLVGRTGSGKSSLLLAILRVVEAASGSILIDGVDVASVELARLRRAVSIIPQDALLFTGSLRSNLDPFGEYSDEQLWEATRKAQLEPAVRAAGGLDCAVEENGRNFSAGQRQLICIARAILRRARLVLIDEATASIDSESDRLVQKMLREQLAHATVITVAHRLATVMDSDLLAVLDAGRLAALDSPAKLLADSPALSAMLESADAAPQSQR